MKRLKTTRQVVDAFGGNRKLAERLRSTPQAVNNWRKSSTFPASLYLILQAEADIAGYVIPDSLFAMRTKRKKR